MSYRKKFTLLIGMMAVVGVLILCGISSADEAISKAIRLHVANMKGVPEENLEIGYQEHVSLPLTGKEFYFSKVIDRKSGEAYSMAMDKDGNLVDHKALQASEKAAHKSTYGKLHPSLYKDIETMPPDEKVKVNIWIHMGDKKADIERLTPDEARGKSKEDIEIKYKEGLKRAKGIHAEVQKPILDFLKGKGLKAIGDAITPIVTAELPRAVIEELALMPDVDIIDQVGEFGLSITGIENPLPLSLGLSDLSTRGTVKADVVEGRGINGNGCKVAIHEDDGISDANPYLNNSTHSVLFYNSSYKKIDDHATACAGFLASTDSSTSRGTAPGISTLLSANSGSLEFGNLFRAADWAIEQGTNTISASWSDKRMISPPCRMLTIDGWADYIVRTYHISWVNSANNEYACVTSPGLGYNVITVGSIDDFNNNNWSDDVMSSYSGWNQPAGRQKPEVSAVGCAQTEPLLPSVGLQSTLKAPPWVGDVGCGTSYATPAVAGMTATLIDRDSGLGIWPEGIKAIVIASAIHNIEGDSRISDYDGAGAIDMAAADYIAANHWWYATSVHGTSFTFGYLTIPTTINLYAGEKFRAALAYDSNPSSGPPYESDLLEGDLDLYLYNSDGVLVAASSGVDSWENIEWTVTTTGTYTLKVYNSGSSLAPTESTYIGVAWWPGHYVLETRQTRGTPTSANDHYRVDTSSTTDWWAIAMRPPSGSDYDLLLYDSSQYDNPVNFTWLEDSRLYSDGVEIVVIDRNHAPSKSYYPIVDVRSGTGDYDIQRAIWGGRISSGTVSQTTTPGFVAKVWDIPMTVGVTKYFSIVPTSGDANLGMLLFDSDPATSSTWYQGRSLAVASTDSVGSGEAEYFTYTAATSDIMGLVVFNKRGQTTNTDWKLYVDEIAPTGSISIKGGTTYTNSTSVPLTLSATDSQTGVYQMRFSNDNATWSSWEAYATSKTWTLTSGDGTKTVYVQYKNNTGMASSSFFDTIILDTTAPMTSDLIISTITAPTTAIPGSTITIGDTTKNQGTGTAGASTTKFYWSTNNTYSGDDTYLGSRPVPLLATGATDTGTINVTVPAGACSGTFYIVARADDGNAVKETNEDNNNKAKSIKIGPDLIISTALIAPATSGEGKTINVTDTTKNNGGCPTTVKTKTMFYLSSDSTWNEVDTVIGERTVGSLAAGATSGPISTSVTIPPGTPTGNYFIIARADAGGVVAETSETNNNKGESIKIGPDLIVSAITVPTTAAKGSSITLGDMTKNSGGGDAGASTTKLYLSTDTTLGAGDVLLCSRPVPALAAGAISKSAPPTSCTIPSGALPVKYYIIVKADAGVTPTDNGVIVETNETNNTKFKVITITP